MALHSRDAVTVSAAVATRSRADCSSMEGHTSLSTALVIILLLLLLSLSPSAGVAGMVLNIILLRCHVQYIYAHYYF